MAHGTDNRGGSTTVLMIVAVAIIAFAGGYFIGTKSGGDTGTSAVEGTAEVGAAARGDAVSGDSTQIPIADSPVLGKASAPITIIEFSEFQCPYCDRGSKTMKEVLEKFPNDVKVVFKHFPLAFHQQAPAASKAAMAAGEQGKFWEMHDLIFQNQKELKGKTDDQVKEWSSGFAKQLGLDVNKFMTDFGNSKYDDIIKRDMDLGQKLAVRGTPHFFVNGERVKGAQPAAKFEEIIKRQLEDAKKMMAAGVKREDLYAKMVEKNFKGTDAPADQAKPQQPATVVQMVEISDKDASKGAKNAIVTIVEFSDFQCPFCTRVKPALGQLMEKYGDKVRIVFKHNPLPFHAEAPAAAEISLAALEQGKFWEMHDALFEAQKEMKGADMTALGTKLAQQIGINANKVKQALESGKYKEQVKADMAQAAKVGARGTPNFFVNGVQLVGAKPYPAFEQEVTRQIEIAEKLQKEKGLKGDALYAAAVEYNKKNAPAAPAAPTPPPQPEPKVDVDKLKVGPAATKGPANAPITIFEFSDFQCPYCSRGNQTLQQVAQKYGDKVRIVFKAFPLPFHKEAEPAHRAALAAGKQGKFWEFHDKLFANQPAIKQLDNLEKYAQELGLNMAKFKTDFESDELKKQVQDEMKEGQAVGVRGTPAFFVNGTRIVGAQPPAKFEEIIEAELKK